MITVFLGVAALLVWVDVDGQVSCAFAGSAAAPASAAKILTAKLTAILSDIGNR